MKVNMLLAYISTHLVTELCFLFAFKKGYLSCPHIVLKWKQSLSECGWKFMQWPGSCWSAWGPQSSWLWHDGQRPILCHTFTKPKGTWSYLLWTITWIIRTSDVCFWALHINSRNEGKFIFLCKNSIWFLGSVNPNLLSKHQLLFKRGHRIAKHSFFCSANQLTSVLSKRREHEYGKETKDVVRRCKSFFMSSAQSDRGGWLTSSECLHTARVQCLFFLYTHETFYFPYMVFSVSIWNNLQ